MWVDPIIVNRPKYSAFKILYGNLRRNSNTCFNFYHMQMQSFDKLLQELTPRDHDHPYALGKNTTPPGRAHSCLVNLGQGV